MDKLLRKNIVFSHLGTLADDPKSTWRPTLVLCRQQAISISRLELFHDIKHNAIADDLAANIQKVSPTTEVCRHRVAFKDPWDFLEAYVHLYDFIRGYEFHHETEDYFIHVSTGTHAIQIAEFLLTESYYFPGKLIQTSPTPAPGVARVIDLDLSKYDVIADRYQRAITEERMLLKAGIETKNPAYNKLIDKIEHEAVPSDEPVLLLGPVGAGKSQLAKRIAAVKKNHKKLLGRFVAANCANYKGNPDLAKSALFGHVKGAFTGAMSDRSGVLAEANGGILFLDEVAELPLDVQTMLLVALEEKTFRKVGGLQDEQSVFDLITGTNANLKQCIAAGEFREDFYSRINGWQYKLPSLKDRPEDIEPNLTYELELYEQVYKRKIRFNAEARKLWLDFAQSPQARWLYNFREFHRAIKRMADTCQRGRIDCTNVQAEIERLLADWKEPNVMGADQGVLDSLLSPEKVAELDQFDAVQVACAIRVCQESSSWAEAGRKLFAISRTIKGSENDSSRVRNYLLKYGITWERLHPEKG